MKPENCVGHWKPTASGIFLLSDPVKNHRIECVQNRVYFLTVFITPNLLLMVFRKFTVHDNKCHQKQNPYYCDVDFKMVDRDKPARYIKENIENTN